MTVSVRRRRIGNTIFGTMLVSMLLLTACLEKPAQSAATVGVEFVVETLFTHEGCTVYRFKDSGDYRYYTNCSGSTSWTTTESCGKSCTRHKPHGVSGGKQ
jgi:hypothetical protein